MGSEMCIRDSTTTVIPLTDIGTFSFSHAVTGLGGVLQFGYRTTSQVVWTSDADLNGSVTVSPVTVPEPTSVALLGLAGIGLATRRRR